MPRCSECGQWLPIRDDARAAGPEAVAAEGREMRIVARFGSAAEAGFFAEELIRRHDIPAQVDVRERRDAHSGWSQEFILLVPADDASRAIDTLRELARDDTAQFDDPERDESEPRTWPWWTLALALALGAAATWGLTRADRRPRLPGLVNRGNRVQDVVGDRPWRQTDGKTVREMVFDPAQGVLKVQEDRDGDGKFENEFRVPWRR